MVSGFAGFKNVCMSHTHASADLKEHPIFIFFLNLALISTVLADVSVHYDDIVLT